MFQIKWCTKQKTFSMQGIPFVTNVGISTLGNTNQLILTHMHILINTAMVAIYF